MRIGLFGGSFDPIHTGHVRPVREARSRLGLERVIYLPTARPPHKPGAQGAPAWARYAMVELALLSEDGLFASAFELTPRPAYTVDTVRHFREQLADAELWLLIGADNFAALESWKEWRRLTELARIGVLLRPGQEPERLRREWSRPIRELAAGGTVRFVANRPVDVSSTRIREALAAGGRPPRGALSALVLEYVRKYSLYR